MLTAVNDAAPTAAQVADSLVNLTTGLGGEKAKGYGTYWVANALDPAQALAAYRGDWIARKAIDIPAFDMIRAGRNWQAPADDITKIEGLERALGLKARRKEALTWGRLFGGAALYLGMDSSVGDPSEELNLEQVTSGSLKYVHALSRFEITPQEVETSPDSEWFGQPRAYTVTGRNGGQARIHPSRVLRFMGAEIPRWGSNGDGWGESILSAIATAVKDAGAAQEAIAGLLQEAKVDVFQVPGLTQQVGSAEYRSRMVERFRLANIAKSTVNALLMDEKEVWAQKQINFANLPEVLQQYLVIAAGAADIPVTRFLGQSPAGMNSTGESDIRNYYDRLAGEREFALLPADERLDEVLIRSALGKRDPQTFALYAPLWQVTATEAATNRKTDSETARNYVDSGLVPLPALAQAVQNSLIETGTFPGLEAALGDRADGLPRVGLPIAMFTAMVAAEAGGAIPPEVIHARLLAAGLLPAGMENVEDFKEAIAQAQAANPEPDEDDLGGERGQGGEGDAPANANDPPAAEPRRAANDGVLTDAQVEALRPLLAQLGRKVAAAE